MTKNAFYFDTEEEARRILESEGRKLKYIALKVWRMYLSSYKPSMYVRTRNSLKGIQLGKIKKITEDTIGIEVTFENDLMYHNSVFGGSYPRGHAIMLISTGWRVKKGRHKDVYRFGYYEGFDYLNKVKEMYENSKDRRIDLEIQWTGKALK